jgi:hypothetical protein
MKNFAAVFVILMLAATAAFSQASTKAQLDSCNARLGDAQMNIRKLNDDIKKFKEEAESCKRNREQAVNAANSERDRATKENENLKKRNAELEAKNKELTESAARSGADANFLQTLAADKDRLATENMNLKNQLAAQSNVVPAPVAPVERFLYPISGVLNNKKVEGNVIIADFVFTNNGSRRVTSFDAVAKFYWKGNKIYEIPLPTIRNQAGFGRGESINFRAGLPVTDQNLVNASLNDIDLVLEVTKVE